MAEEMNFLRYAQTPPVFAYMTSSFRKKFHDKEKRSESEFNSGLAKCNSQSCAKVEKTSRTFARQVPRDEFVFAANHNASP